MEAGLEAALSTKETWGVLCHARFKIQSLKAGLKTAEVTYYMNGFVYCCMSATAQSIDVFYFYIKWDQMSFEEPNDI